MAILLPLLANMTVRIWADPPDSPYSDDYYPKEPASNEERAKLNAEMEAKIQQWKKDDAAFQLQFFYVSFPLGILEILAGVMLRRKATLAAGLIFGGLVTVAFGSYSAWEQLPGTTRYVSLLFTLLFLAGLAHIVDKGGNPNAPLARSGDVKQ